MTWSPAQYLKFEDERSRPARDLLAAVPLAAARSVIDLGCGPGNSTELLHARFPVAELIGVDSSREMLVAARQRLPAATFVEADIAEWSPPPGTDLLFANAVFQWVPDHLETLVRFLQALTRGGVIALQMPDNLDEESHRLMRAVAEEGPWRDRFATPVAREAIPAAGAYYDRLAPLATRVDIWRTVYHHPLADADAIVEWVKGTGLRPFLDRLGDDERLDFLAAYRQRIAAAYPKRADGKVLLSFPRLFIVAVR